ncbi:hypothetical protein AHAS_Ahas12G0259700 [Arachis hypogaea]
MCYSALPMLEKLTRLKQAKEEADKEVAEYRAQLEREFQQKVSDSTGDSGANVKRLEHETEGKIHHLKTEAARISDDVVAMLLKYSGVSSLQYSCFVCNTWYGLVSFCVVLKR